jgi:hypothetical protein
MRSFIIYSLHQIFYLPNEKQYRHIPRLVKMKNSYNILLGKFEGRNYFGNLITDGRNMVKIIVRK